MLRARLPGSLLRRRPAAVRGPGPAARVEHGVILAIAVGAIRVGRVPAGVDAVGRRLSTPARPPRVVGRRVVGRRFPAETARVAHVTLPCGAGMPLWFELRLSAGQPEQIRSGP